MRDRRRIISIERPANRGSHASVINTRRAAAGPPKGRRSANVRRSPGSRNAAPAMGVIQYTSTHKFDALPDGGRIELQNDKNDSVAFRGSGPHSRHCRGLQEWDSRCRVVHMQLTLDQGDGGQRL